MQIAFDILDDEYYDILQYQYTEIKENREIIEMLKILKVLKEQALKSGYDTVVLKVNSDSFNFVLDESIKALEQNPAIDRIRAEIERHRQKTRNIDPYDLVGDCLDIIDKYKAESEG